MPALPARVLEGADLLQRALPQVARIGARVGAGEPADQRQQRTGEIDQRIEAED